MNLRDFCIVIEILKKNKSNISWEEVNRLVKLLK